MPIQFRPDWITNMTKQQIIDYLLHLTMLRMWLMYVKYYEWMLNQPAQLKVEYEKSKDFGHHWIMDQPELEYVNEPVLDWRI